MYLMKNVAKRSAGMGLKVRYQQAANCVLVLPDLTSFRLRIRNQNTQVCDQQVAYFVNAILDSFHFFSWIYDRNARFMTVWFLFCYFQLVTNRQHCCESGTARYQIWYRFSCSFLSSTQLFTWHRTCFCLECQWNLTLDPMNPTTN